MGEKEREVVGNVGFGGDFGTFDCVGYLVAVGGIYSFVYL